MWYQKARKSGNEIPVSATKVPNCSKDLPVFIVLYLHDSGNKPSFNGLFVVVFLLKKKKKKKKKKTEKKKSRSAVSRSVVPPFRVPSFRGLLTTLNVLSLGKLCNHEASLFFCFSSSLCFLVFISFRACFSW